MEQQLLGVIGKRHLWQPVLVCHLHGEKTEEQQDVVASIAKRRQVNGNGVEPIIQILTEAAFRYRLAHVDVCGRHYAHVGLPYLLASHANVFTSLKHSEQPCLRSHWQLAHLVEEDGAFVCHAKIAITLAHGTRVGTFLMAEELAVDSSLRNGAAVDGEVFLTPTRRVVVDDAWNDFLSHSTLTYDKHAEVGRSHLQRHIERVVQIIAVAHDVVALLYSLQFRRIHWVTKLHIFFVTAAILADYFAHDFSVRHRA